MPTPTPSRIERVLSTLASLKLAIVCLLSLMVLVVACTLAQVELGTHGAVTHYMRSTIVWWKPAGQNLSYPVFPGGTTVGLVLFVNLVAAQIRRLELSWRKVGLWIVHAGLILLVAAEFVSAALQVDGQMAIEVGDTSDYVERPREYELAIQDTTDPKFNQVYSLPEGLLRPGAILKVADTPLSVRVIAAYRNATVGRRDPSDPPALATAGVGTAVTVRPAPEVTNDDERDSPAVVAEFVAGGRSYGTWLASAAMGAPQSFLHEGHSYELALRPRREYLPYSITLKKFTHDIYAGTDIPKNFASLVQLVNRNTGEDREVLIYMNQPLRYAGRTFYQASFGKNDQLSILQVVENPGWLLPYISCVLVTLGLLIHFAVSLRRSQRKRQRVTLEASEAAP